MVDLKSALGGIGTALTGFSMGAQGRGAEFAQGLQQQDQARVAADKARQQEMQQTRAIASGVMLSSLKDGKPDVAFEFGTNLYNQAKAGGASEQDMGDLVNVLTMIRTDPKKAQETLGPLVKQYQWQGLLPKVEEDKTMLESRKELRGELRKSTEKIREEVSATNTNYNKVMNLSGEVDKGNRTAVAQLLISIVKIGDPGSTVNQGELEAALNQQNPAAFLAEKGVSSDVISTIMTKLDPLSPGNIKIDDVKATANALVSANVPSLIGRFEDARSRGEGFLTESGFKSVFGGQLAKRVEELKKYTPVAKHETFGDITEDDIETTMKKHNLTRQQVLDKLGEK